MKTENALGKLYYGMHMLPGCAEYREPGASPFRIFINESTIKKMDASFQGRPVFVLHKDEPKEYFENIRNADGIVVRSFYNPPDGKHWAEFMVFTEKGRAALQNGWRLSNAYIPKGYAAGGLWNGIEYSKEVTSGEYEHLAIVPNPRYDESVIYDAEQFKQYNEKKELDLKRLANSQEDQPVGLNIFKRQKVENAADYENTMVTLPKSKVDKTLVEVVELADKFVNMAGYAADEHMVKCNDGSEMSVKKLRDSYSKMKNDEEERVKKENEGLLDPGEEEGKKDKKKADETDEKGSTKGDKTKNSSEDKEDKKDDKKANFDKLKNASEQANLNDPIRIDLDKVARGKARYGSN